MLKWRYEPETKFTMTVIIESVMPERGQCQDAKFLQIAEGVASEVGLGLAMRLFDLDSFQILYEEKLQTKVNLLVLHRQQKCISEGAHFSHHWIYP